MLDSPGSLDRFCIGQHTLARLSGAEKLGWHVRIPWKTESRAQRALLIDGAVTKPRGFSVVWCIIQNVEAGEESGEFVVASVLVQDFAQGFAVVAPLRIVPVRPSLVGRDPRDIAIDGDV